MDYQNLLKFSLLSFFKFSAFTDSTGMSGENSPLMTGQDKLSNTHRNKQKKIKATNITATATTTKTGCDNKKYNYKAFIIFFIIL